MYTQYNVPCIFLSVGILLARCCTAVNRKAVKGAVEVSENVRMTASISKKVASSYIRVITGLHRGGRHSLDKVK